MKTKRLIAILLALVLAFSLCACGSKEPDPNVATYNLYACSFEEYDNVLLKASEIFDGENYLRLDEKNKAVLSLDGDETSTTWKLDGTKITLDEKGDPLTGKLKDGIITLEEGGGTLYFARPTADLSDLEPITIDEYVANMFGGDEPEPDPEPEPVQVPALTPEPEPEKVVDHSLDGKKECKNGILSDGDAYIEILCAEAINTDEDEAGVRFWYEFTNLSDDTYSAWDLVELEAYQDGVELETAYADEDVDEWWYDIYDVRPGATIRIAAEYAIDPDGGPVRLEVFDSWDDEDYRVMKTFALDEFSAPKDKWEPAPVNDPSAWTDMYPWEGDIDDFYVEIGDAEVVDGWMVDEAVRIYVEATNNGDEAQSLSAVSVVTGFQDGIEVFTSYADEDIDEDFNYGEEVEPGETITISFVFPLNYYAVTDTPFEFIISDFQGHTIGGYYS